VVNGADPMAYLSLIRSPAKTIVQTGQIGAIVLADALVVGSFSLHPSVKNLSNLQVYRTLVVWNYNIYVIVVPCLTFVATTSEFQKLVRKKHMIIIPRQPLG